MTGQIKTAIGMVPIVSTDLTCRDRLGSWKARWGIGRMGYTISPGLYAIGQPGVDAPVLVSANYKMSFDRLRQELVGLNLWMLVLDTKGVNVWCAAGKGTFGTQELVERVIQVRLAEVVTHRTIILPQLGAVGVAAHEVLKLCGFKVVYGPVRASDLPAFLQAGLMAQDAMREVRFGILDRLVLTPIELVGVIRPTLILLAILLLKNIIVNGFAQLLEVLGQTVIDFIPYLGAILTGAVLTPVLLPIIPGRAFAWKGWLLGVGWAGAYSWVVSAGSSALQTIAYLLILPAISAFLAMNFTGATTYTSLSGVEREMKLAVPAILTSAGLGNTIINCWHVYLTSSCEIILGLIRKMSCPHSSFYFDKLSTGFPQREKRIVGLCVELRSYSAIIKGVFKK